MNSFITQANDLRTRFQKRGYPDEVLRDAFSKVVRTSRENLLVPKKRDQEEVIRIIGTYDNKASEVRHFGEILADTQNR